MIKAIIFGFNGVIVRTEDYSLRHAWDKRLDLPPGSVERAVCQSDIWIQAQLGRLSLDAYWNGVAELLYIRREDLPVLLPELRRDFFSGDHLNHRVVALIRDLKAAGQKIALLANETAQLCLRLRELAIDDLFDQVMISAQTGVMLPDPTAYRVALRKLGTSPKETLFVDEHYIHIRGAQAVGLHTLLFRPEGDLRADLTRYLESQASPG